MTAAADRVRVTHVINSFEYGGAEAMLGNLLARCDRDRFDPTVVALIDDMTVAGPVRDAGIPIVTMGMKPGVPDPRGVARLARHLRRARPQVVQTWMDHSNLIGGLAARAGLGRRARVVWGVHHARHVPGVAKRSTLWTVSACGRLSRWVPDRVVFVSGMARGLYAASGFDDARAAVIPNGFDTGRFRPDPAARLSLRAELGVDPDVTLVGLAARFDPNKDHANFLRAAARVATVYPDVRFVLCGGGVDDANEPLAAQVGSLGLGGRCHLLGPRRDVPRVLAGLDVAVSSSLSEAFPLAVGEAMACGVPVAATDVGDTGVIVGPHGKLVPPSQPQALAFAISELLTMSTADRRRLGLAGRRRVCERFDLGAVTRRYEALYDELVGRRRPAEPGPAPDPAPAPAGAGR